MVSCLDIADGPIIGIRSTVVCGLEQAVLPSPIQADLAKCCREGGIGVDLVIRHHHADDLHMQNSDLPCRHIPSWK